MTDLQSILEAAVDAACISPAAVDTAAATALLSSVIADLEAFAGLARSLKPTPGLGQPHHG